MEINLGDRVKDKISGMTGIVVCKASWLYGCTRISIQPEATKDGHPVDLVHLDEPQVEVVQARVHEHTIIQSTGGPWRETPGFQR